MAVLKTGVGARALAMGGAFTAVADNVDAQYWNPAGLSNIKLNEFTGMYVPLSDEANYYYVSYARPLWFGTGGISLIRVSPNTLPQDENAADELPGTRVFAYTSTGYALSYGFNMAPNVSFGLTAKYLTSKMFPIAGGDAYGYSITPGILIMIPVGGNRFTMGAKVDGLLNEQSWGTGSKEQVPSKLRIGLAYRLGNPGLFAVDVSRVMKAGYDAEVSLGYEWAKDWLALRAGYVDSVLTTGLGLQLGIVQLDYAHVPLSSLTRNVHRVSLSVRI